MTRDEVQIEAARYTTRTTKIDMGKGFWSHLRVEVLRDGEAVGEYRRYYSSMYQTFHPFVGVDGQVYALYSRSYTATRVMRLPSCEDVGGEEPSGNGFGTWAPAQRTAVSWRKHTGIEPAVRRVERRHHRF